MSAPNRRRPDILIRQYGADTTIRMGRSASIPLPLAAPQDIRRVVKQFLKKIETVRPEVVEPSITAARDFIRIARQSAYDCFTAVSTGSLDDIAEVVGEMESRKRYWTRMGDPPFIEVVVNDSEYLPWEWLAEPISRHGREIDGLDMAQNEGDATSKLVRDALDVLGFYAIVRRVLVKSKPLGDETRGSRGYLVSKSNTLQVRYVRHSGLSGASQQEGYFNSLGSAISLVGPLPDARRGLPIGLVSQLLDPGLDSIVRGHRLGGLDQVVHLHCHH
jgi:hypothetical protein